MNRTALLLIVMLPFVAPSASAFEAGERVVAIKPAEMKTLSDSKAMFSPGSTMKVLGVEGNRLKVASGRIGWIEASMVIDATKGEAHFNALIDSDPKNAANFFARGKFRFENGDKEGAIADMDRGLEISPNSEALAIRGFAWKRSGDKDKAMADFDAAIKLNPKEALAWRVRGATWASKAEYEKALADYSESIRVDPENPDSLHHRVIMLSGCMDDKIRNGAQAVKDATEACEVSGWQNPLYLSGLAFAYAETGDFEAAIKWTKKASEVSPNSADFLKGRIEQFEQRKPLRMTWK